MPREPYISKWVCLTKIYELFLKLCISSFNITLFTTSNVIICCCFFVAVIFSAKPVLNSEILKLHKFVMGFNLDTEQVFPWFNTWLGHKVMTIMTSYSHFVHSNSELLGLEHRIRMTSWKRELFILFTGDSAEVLFTFKVIPAKFITGCTHR